MAERDERDEEREAPVGLWEKALRVAFLANDGAPGPAAGEILGDFRIVREVGRGGMGVVYEARQVSLERTVALKVLPYHVTLSPDAVARFHREARMTARLEHPGIVEIYTVERTLGAHFYAMEFVEGAPLDRVIARAERRGVAGLNGTALGRIVRSGCHRPSSSRERSAPCPDPGTPTAWTGEYVAAVLDLAIQVAEALHYAHDRGIVHRDIKPANILIRADGSAVITDFGLARCADASALTRSSQFVGTLRYAPPEHACISGAQTDRRWDVYSLGVTLYEMLALSQPFSGDAAPENLAQILRREPLDPRRRNPSIGRELSAVVLKAMDKVPKRRYRTARAFADDLRAARDGNPVTARPVSAMTRGLRVLHRTRNWIGAVLLLLALIVTAALWGARSTHRAPQTEAEYWRMVVGAASHLDAGDLGAAQAILERCFPGYRGWEWDHLMLRCRLGLEPSPEAPEASAALALPLASRSLRSLAISPDGRRLATGCWPGRIRIYDAECGEHLTNLDVEWRAPNQIVWHAGTGRILVSADDTIGACEAEGGRIERLATVSGASEGLALHPDGRRVVRASSNGTVVVLDADSGAVLRTWNTGEHLHSLAFGPDGRLFLGTSRGPISVWNIDSATRLCELTGHADLVDSLAVAPDGETLFSGARSGLLRRWNLNTGECTHRVRLQRWIRSLCVSPDGSRLVCGFMEQRDTPRDRAYVVLSVRSARSPGFGVDFLGQDGRVNSLAFSANGDRLFVISAHSAGVLFRLRETARPFWRTAALARRGQECLDRLRATVGVGPVDDRWPETIVRRVRQDPETDPPLRHAVEALAEAEMYRLSVDCEERSNSGPLDKRLEWARHACALRSSPLNLIRLAELQYRSGQYAEALATLNLAREENHRIGTPYPPVRDEFFRAMCLHHLGEAGRARALLESIGEDGLDRESRKLREEAWQLVAGLGD